MSSFVSEWKNRGNEAFKREDFDSAIDAYSKALSEHARGDELRATLLCNRAACHLKLLRYQDTITDCGEALQIVPTMGKALFRRACAYEGLHQSKECVKDLAKLLHLDPNNASGIAMMRRVKETMQHELTESSEVWNIMEAVQKDGSKLTSGLGSLIGLCYDDRNHAMDLFRKGGVSWISEVINHALSSWEPGAALSSKDTLVSALRVLSAASNHKEFVLSAMDIATEDAIFAHGRFSAARLTLRPMPGSKGLKLAFTSVCSLLPVVAGTSALPPVLLLIMNTLRAFPIALPSPAAADSSSAPPVYTVSKYAGQALLTGLCAALGASSAESFAAVTDTISAFLSDSADYYDTPAKEIDTRLESTEARQKRLNEIDLVRGRCKAHCSWALECGILTQLVQNVDSEISTIRLNSSNCLGKVVNYVDNDDLLKEKLLPFLPGQAGQEEPSESKRVVEIVEVPLEPLSVPLCRRRAALTATLLLARPDLGTWALELPGGVAQLHFLVAKGDVLCQEVAAEVICLASATQNGAAVLASVVSSGTLTTLLHAPSASIRAAAASTITKLSIKAKALTQDSAEVAQIMNTALAVLKAANSPAAPGSATDTGKGDALVSFSALDEVSASRAQQQKKAEADKAKDGRTGLSSSGALSGAGAGVSGGITMTSVERAIESLAALVGKSYIKEEIVHGSYRVAACVQELTKLDLDVRSTAAYGVAHILCALTVTNRELRAIALAEKDITPEQYDQMQELQRIKTKDEDGRVIEEKKEETDSDTAEMCRRRIQRIVACDAVRFLVKYLTSGSAQTKEAAARALRQMAVEVSVRGSLIQQGALKACCTAACDEDNKKTARMEAAHCVAKILVTTNPNLLSEHQRLGSVKPLVMLCKESGATDLQHFETLLALTNVLSCGEAEHEKLAAEKGVTAVHYLIFSENWMVRRAAVEALCNMAASEHLLKLLRVPDKVRLWLGLCEEGAAASVDEEDEDEPTSENVEATRKWKEEQQERYLTARAAAGTLAMAAGVDDQVCVALCEQNCAKTLVALLETAKPELVHRALVWITEMVSAPQDEQLRLRCGTHLMEGGIVPAIGVVLKMGDAQLGGLAREAALVLSKAVEKAPL